MRTALTTTLSESDLELIRQVHGHICPAVLLGARLALAAVTSYRTEGNAAAKPYGYFRGQGCAVDGIQLFSGCTLGNANLVLLRGRTLEFIFTSEGSATAVTTMPRQTVLARIREERSQFLETELGRNFGTVADEEILEARQINSLSVLSLFPES